MEELGWGGTGLYSSGYLTFIKWSPRRPQAALTTVVLPLPGGPRRRMQLVPVSKDPLKPQNRHWCLHPAPISSPHPHGNPGMVESRWRVTRGLPCPQARGCPLQGGRGSHIAHSMQCGAGLSPCAIPVPAAYHAGWVYTWATSGL